MACDASFLKSPGHGRYFFSVFYMDEVTVMLILNDGMPVSGNLHSHGYSAVKPMEQKRNIYELFNDRYPGLIGDIKEVIEDSEFKYCKGSRSESFLWQHTVYVASMAMKIAYAEGLDPVLPVVTALFHDCGKFENGKYHEGEKPEEEAGAEIASRLLEKAGFSELDQYLVRESLLALYNENKVDNINTRIVHDSDFLIKFGHMGFANFFEKSVLRGMVIRNSILKAMSKELTYAASLESNMFTPTGKKMARKKAAITVSLFRNYLEELRETAISDYEIKEMEINCCKGPDDIIPLILVLPRFCEHCYGPLAISFEREKGIKCERLIVNIHCSRCHENTGYDFSFCLPELGVV